LQEQPEVGKRLGFENFHISEQFTSDTGGRRVSFSQRPQSPIPLAFGTEGAQAASVPKVPKARDWVDWPVRVFVFSGVRVRGVILLKQSSFGRRMAITL
jgi:hypothetical protein